MRTTTASTPPRPWLPGQRSWYRITEIDEGRTFGTSATDPVASSSIVLEFAVTQVLNGGAPAGKVYVELPAPGQVTAEVFRPSSTQDP